MKEEAEAYWESLSDENKLKAFYAVCSRIHKAELEDQSTYRHALYEVFGFGPDSYRIDMQCGFFDIHNSIYCQEELKDIVRTVLRASQLDESSVNWDNFYRYYYGPL